MNIRSKKKRNVYICMGAIDTPLKLDRKAVWRWSGRIMFNLIPMYWLLLDKWSNLMSFHRYKWQSAAKHILFSMCNMNILRIGGITDCYWVRPSVDLRENREDILYFKVVSSSGRSFTVHLENTVVKQVNAFWPSKNFLSNRKKVPPGSSGHVTQFYALSKPIVPD